MHDNDSNRKTSSNYPSTMDGKQCVPNEKFRRIQTVIEPSTERTINHKLIVKTNNPKCIRRNFTILSSDKRPFPFGQWYVVFICHFI